MGYTTEFEGRFDLNKVLDDETFDLLTKLAATRRMKRDVDSKYGVEGEFYVLGKGYAGQDREPNVIDSNHPPRSQPGLWLQWIPTEDRKGIEWDQGEKFYDYVDWIKYLIDAVLAPKGYILNGTVRWRGEEFSDLGSIVINDNLVATEDF